MNKELTITIAGQAGTGKSTIMYELYKLLWINGFDVTVTFENDYDFKDEKDFRMKMGDEQNERMESLKKDVKITIKTIQTKREHKETYSPDQD